MKKRLYTKTDMFESETNINLNLMTRGKAEFLLKVNSKAWDPIIPRKDELCSPETIFRSYIDLQNQYN